MRDTRLIKIIRTFTKEELKSFEKFLQSPFLKPVRDTSELYYYIIKFYPDYENSKLEKPKVFEKLFPGESYNEKKLINLIFDLTKAAEDFLAFSTLIEDETDFLLNLSKGFSKKYLSEESNRINKLIEKKLKPGFSQSKDYISKFRQLTHLKGIYFTENNEFENLIESKKQYFEASAVQFIIDYIEVLSSKDYALKTYGKNIENYFIESVIKSFDIEKLLNFLEKSDYVNKSLIKIHYHILKTKQEPDKTEHYFSLRDLFYKNLSELDREEKYFVFVHLINYCVQQFSNVSVSFKKEALDAAKKMMDNESYSYSETEYFNVMTYRNIVYFCITVKDLKWLEYFIEKYSSKLELNLREDIKNFSYTQLYFVKNEFEKALEASSKINNEFFLFKADLKNILLKIYYELGYTEQAFSMVDSYKHYLAKSSEITKDFKIDYTNFLNYYMNLLKIKSQQGKEKPGFIRDKISKEIRIVNKGWLIEKAGELMVKVKK